LACLLLLLIFALRRRQQLLATQALTVTASVSVCAIIVCVWELCDRIAHFPFAPLVMDKIQIWVDPGGMQNHPDNLDNLS
jgi:hypothetical protein